MQNKKGPFLVIKIYNLPYHIKGKIKLSIHNILPWENMLMMRNY